MSICLALFPQDLTDPICGLKTGAGNNSFETVHIQQVVAGIDARKGVAVSHISFAPDGNRDDLNQTFTIRDREYSPPPADTIPLPQTLERWDYSCIAAALYLLRMSPNDQTGAIVLPEDVMSEALASVEWSGGWVETPSLGEKIWVPEPTIFHIGELLLWDWFTEEKSEALGPSVSEDRIARGAAKQVAVFTTAASDDHFNVSRYFVQSQPSGLSIEREDDPVQLQGDIEEIDGVWDLMIDARNLSEAGAVSIDEAVTLSVTAGLAKLCLIDDEGDLQE